MSDEFAFRPGDKPGTTVGQSSTIIRMRKKGIPHSQIGLHLGTTEQAVKQAAGQLMKDGRLKAGDIPPRSAAQARREGRGKISGSPRGPTGEDDGG